MKRLIAILLLCAAATSGLAQSPAEGRGLAVGDRSVEKTAGFSWYSPAASSLGDVSHRRVYLAGIRGNWIEELAGPFALAYSMEFVPLAVVERTGPNSRSCFPLPTGNTACRLDYSHRLAAGIGGSPVGARVYLNRNGKWRAHAGGAAGALVFSNEVPIFRSRQFNFTFEYGVAVDRITADGKAITIGYKFHHISNAGTGELNPGLDANVVYVGLTRWRQSS
jgi:hypothetical protein